MTLHSDVIDRMTPICGGTTTSTGTGNLAISGTLPYLRDLGTGLTDGLSYDFYVFFDDLTTSGYELFRAQWQASPQTILRSSATMFESSAGGSPLSKVNWAAGTKRVYVVTSPQAMQEFPTQSYYYASHLENSPLHSQAIANKTWTAVEFSELGDNTSDTVYLWEPSPQDADWRSKIVHIDNTRTDDGSGRGYWMTGCVVAWENTVTSPLMPVHRRKMKIQQRLYFLGIPTWLDVAESEILYHPDAGDYTTTGEEFSYQHIYLQPGISGALGEHLTYSPNQERALRLVVWHNAGVTQNLRADGLTAPLFMNAKVSNLSS